jgi:hypothetical protein
VNESRWEDALHATKGLGDLRRDVAILMGVAAPMFVGLRLLSPGSLAGDLLYSLLVGFGVLVLVPLFELLWNYRRARGVPSEGARPPEQARPPEEAPAPDHVQLERERELRERLRRGPG